MLKKISYLIVSIVLLLSGCQMMDATYLVGPDRMRTLNDIMTSWVGSQESALVGSWGAPNATYQNRDGSVVATWKSVYTDPYYNTTGICEKTFLIGATGIVEKWRYNGHCQYAIHEKPYISKEIPIPQMTL